MHARRLLPAFLIAALIAFMGFGSSANAQDPPKPAEEPAKVEMPDLTKPATLKDVSDLKTEALKASADATTAAHKYSDIAWMLVATALVMLMMPGLALFYGGMTRRKNVLGTMMHTFIALGLVGVQWVTFGYSLSFGESVKKISISNDSDGKPIEGSIIGYSPELLFLGATAAVGTKEDDVYKAKKIDPKTATDEQKKEVTEETAKQNRFMSFPNTNLPLYLHAMFQGMFAIITVALVSGAFAERVKFLSYLIFALIWTTIVYDPLAHMVWSFEWSYLDSQKTLVPLTEASPVRVAPAAGLLGVNGAIDFAGGTVVHIAAGFSGLAAILLLRKRIGYGKQSFHPNSMVLTLLGAGLLWFGWFGFNGGSALYSNGQAVSAFTVTQVAAAMAGLSWIVVEWLHRGKPTGLGFASGLVAGLVAITPASGYVDPSGALIIGLASGIVCYLAVAAKSLLGYDDSLDAFGIHGVGGFLGAILTGALVSLPLWIYGSEMPAASFPGKSNIVDGVVVFDRSAQLMWQIKAACFSAVYAFLATSVLVLIIDKTIGFTLKPSDESAGLDLSQHGETGFDMGPDVDAGAVVEPKSASAPPAMAAGKADRFTVVLDGADATKLRTVWADMCKPHTGTAPRKEFNEVYKYLTTINGNKFRFRGGNPAEIKAALAKLFSDALNQSGLQAHVEH